MLLLLVIIILQLSQIVLMSIFSINYLPFCEYITIYVPVISQVIYKKCWVCFRSFSVIHTYWHQSFSDAHEIHIEVCLTCSVSQRFVKCDLNILL